MFALDLFNTRYERALQEGALDDTITRTQAHLMEPLSLRAAECRNELLRLNQQLKNTPFDDRSKRNQIVGKMDDLEKEYADLVDKRMKILKGEITSQEECMGYGGIVGEAGLPDVADKADKMARLTQPNKVGTDTVKPQQRVNPNPNKGVIGHAADWLRGKGGPGQEGPTYEDLDEAEELSNISIARYVYAQILKALKDNLQFDTIYWPQGDMQGPRLEATLSRNQMHYLIERLVKMTREQRKQFTQRVLSDRNATLQWLTSKPIKTAPTMAQQNPEVIQRYGEPNPAQGSLDLPKPVGEAQGQKKNSKKADPDLNAGTAQDATVQRLSLIHI